MYSYLGALPLAYEWYGHIMDNPLIWTNLAYYRELLAFHVAGLRGTQYSNAVFVFLSKVLFMFRYGTLDVKNILLETVSHHIVPQMLRSPLLLETVDLLWEYLKFMDDHLREAADLTFLAYRHRNYSKVCSLIDCLYRFPYLCSLGSYCCLEFIAFLSFPHTNINNTTTTTTKCFSQVHE